MSVLIRKLGAREYAYWVRRVAGKVVQTYLGPANDQAVRERINTLKVWRRIPAFLHELFWDTDPKRIDTRKHARYILERILEMGSLPAMLWAQRHYPASLILEVAEMSRSVSERSKNFWKLWFGVESGVP